MSSLVGILFFVLGSALFVPLSFLVSAFLRPHRPNNQKLSTYESGEQAVGSAWIPFNMRFYGVALLFVLFELEMTFLLPFIFALKGKSAFGALIEVMIFVLLLALGLVYGWKKGFLRWQRPDRATQGFVSKVPKQLYESINEKYRINQRL